MSLFGKAKGKSTKETVQTWAKDAQGYCLKKIDAINQSSAIQSISFVLSSIGTKVSDAKEGVTSVSGTAAYVAKSALYQDAWNEIIDGLFVGGLPIETRLAHFGQHGSSLINTCVANERPLAAVFSIANTFELQGKGLIGLTPVQPDFWTKKKVTHQQVPMNIQSGQLELKALNSLVDQIHSHISKKKSVLIHCNNGQSRSPLVAACYLVKHKNMNVTDALAAIYAKRSTVTFSAAELALIENFRLAHASNKAKLNTKSQKFDPLRRDWTNTFGLRNPLIQFALFEGTSRVLDQTSMESRVVAGSAIALNKGINHLRRKIGAHAYEHLEQQYPTLSDEEKSAVNTGIESAQSWRAWGKGFFNTNTLFHYSSYLAGQRAWQEDNPICDKVAKEAAKNKPK